MPLDHRLWTLRRELLAAVCDQLPITHRENSRCLPGDDWIVGNKHDGPALGIDLLEERHDASTRSAVEVSGRLVGQEQGRGIDQRTRDSNALLLAT
jgi:hypothetical protein